MRKDTRFPLLASVRRRRWTPVLFQGCPSWQRATERVAIVGDLKRRSFAELDYLFAIFASNGDTIFTVTCSGTTVDRWLKSVGRRSVGAAERYERQMRANFQRYKADFREGYSLPQPPTPELRVIYDSAAKNECRPTNPCETTLHSGFTGDEYHWRPWPLGNVIFAEVSP